MKKLKDKSGRITQLELILIIVICAVAGFFAFASYNWADVRYTHGNDDLRLNTADSVARINSNNGLNCVVHTCMDGSTGKKCVHYDVALKGYVGYFDAETNTIVGFKPKGYNENKKVCVKKHCIVAEPNTMVIQVVAKDNDIKLSWVKGR